MTAAQSSVLVVDDEPAIRETTAALLEDDHEVVQADNPAAALALLRSRSFDVICTDHRMPGMTGVELLREARKLYPGIYGIIVTAYADYPDYQAELHSVRCLVVLKPYEATQLLDLVERATRLAKMKQLTQDTVERAERLNAKR